MHELDKLDTYLGVPTGTSRSVIVSHQDPTLLNEKLQSYGIILDRCGMVKNDQKPIWRELMRSVGVDRRYWKDKEATSPAPVIIEDLESSPR